MKTGILIWDLPTRWFHWLLAASFAGAWLTSESERYGDLHVMLGYTMLGLIAFRLVWGFAGTRYARFRDFAYAPGKVVQYLKSLSSGRPEHYLGHNPAGAVAIFLLLALGIVTGVSGWLTYNEIGGEWWEEGHELFANAMLVVVGVHIAGVLVSSFLHRENLARAMVTGCKQGEPGDAIDRKRGGAALLLVVAVAGFWGLWFNGNPDALVTGRASAQSVENNDYGGKDELHERKDGHDEDD
ncbi:MAG: cytochrome b/b6 domain-containing protein [Pseudomonadota bacterium]